MRKRLSEQRAQYRIWTAEQKLAIVLAGLRGDRLVKETYLPDGAGPAIGVQDMPPRDDA
jgi:hypothetical protein